MSDKIITSCENLHRMPVFSQLYSKEQEIWQNQKQQRNSYGHKHSMPPQRCNLFGYEMIIQWHSFHVVVSCSLCCYWFSFSCHLNAELIRKIQISNHIIYCLMVRMVWGSNPCGHKILRTNPDQHWGPPSSCTMHAASLSWK